MFISSDIDTYDSFKLTKTRASKQTKEKSPTIRDGKTDEEKLEKLGVDKAIEESPSATASTPVTASYNLLPCSNEIWLPAEDSLLNIESETVIPETALPSQLVLDYEYKMITAGLSHPQRQSIRQFGTYTNKTSSTRSEIKPNGVVIIWIMRNDESKDKFGLKMRRNSSDGEFCVDGIQSASEAHRLGLFQVIYICVKLSFKNICIN